MSTLTIPATALPGETIPVDGAGFTPKTKFALTTVDANGVEVGQTSNTNRPRPDGTFHVGINVPPLVGPAKVRAYQGSTMVAEASVLVAVAAPPPVVSGIFGPGVAADGKDNRPVGRSDDSHYAAVWDSAGGTVTSVATNQRFGPNQSNPGMGYSHGTGGMQRLTFQGVTNGLPNGQVIATKTFMPTNPGTDAEDRRPIPFSAVLPAGPVALVADNIDADPTNNWMSQNCLYNPQGKPQPGTSWKVAERVNGSAWRFVGGNTPTVQVTFTDHVEGQGYGSIIANTDLDGSGQFSGFQLSGSRFVRQRLTAPAPFTVTAAWLRAKRLAGTGSLYAFIADSQGHADVAVIPTTTKADLNGGTWVRVSIIPVRVSGAFTVSFSTSAVLDVMPIRKDGFEQDGWTIPNNGGWAEKSMDGTTWADLYSRGTDLQMYLEVAS